MFLDNKMADEESAPIEPVEEEKSAVEEASPAHEDQVPTEEEALPAPEAEEQIPAGEDSAADDANNNAAAETDKATEEAQMEGEQATEVVAIETGGGDDEQATEVAEGEGEAKMEGEAEAIGEGQAEEEAAEEKKVSGGDDKTGEEDDVKEGEEEEEKAEEDDGEDEEAKQEGDDEGTTHREEQDVSKSPIPKSDTFAEGDRAESPTVGVGEKLSREASPVEEERELGKPDILEPGTPERSRPGSEADEEEDEEGRQLDTFEEEDEEEEEEEKPQFDREELMERYHQAIAEREQLQQQNYQLQHKLAEYFRKKKADDSRQDYDKNVTDQEQRYLKYMAQLEDLRRQDLQQRDGYKDQIEELKKKCEERKERVDKEKQAFMELKKQVAFNSINSRSGKPIPPKDIEQYLSAENKKEAEVVNVRLENIKLKNKLRKKEQQLKSKEELAEGLHLIDFEQLKIENQTYNEKIEERNEELLKLRKKITSTVQVLTHLKEKLQYVQRENQIQKERLREVEAEVGHVNELSKTKLFKHTHTHACTHTHTHTTSNVDP
ncbi:hypothetical protein ACJMK2_035425 [Sinanodonta woodiana]|uniref:CCDC113/CCDC96 coiled-coil domain-containing protein n=1 Tax=Sinanodonta woodiana TaxID=1069815 RepID=A0ABD3WYE5_SINWO